MATTPIPARPPGEPPSNYQTSPNRVAFDPKAAVPQQPVYIQRNDAVLLLCNSNMSGYSIGINYRWLTPDGEIKEGELDTTPTIGRHGFFITLFEGWLLSFGCHSLLPLPSGTWIYLQASLIRGFVPGSLIFSHGLIWQGFLGAFASSGWPGMPSKDIGDGTGIIRSITGTTPAAGADISETVPANRRWTLLAFAARLTTSATVANRFPGANLTDGTNSYFGIDTNTAQVASTVVQYNLTPGSTFYNDTQSHEMIPLPNLVQLKAGFQIKTNTVALQAGDQWAAPQYVVLEWGNWEE